MGIDYVPFDIKAGITEEELEENVTDQATAFQSMPYFWNTEWKIDKKLNELLVSLHKRTCLDASAAIRSKIDLKPASYRIAAVSNNGTFPINLRTGSLTTILPSKLDSYITSWEKAHDLATAWALDTDEWKNHIEWFEKFLPWVKSFHQRNCGLYLCW